MWEAIAANRRRSRVLIFCLGLLLLAMGAAVGTYFDPQNGMLFGVGLALVIWLVMTLTALWAGDSILLSTAGAHRIEKDDAPQLYNVVDEMRIAAGLAKMPDIYVIEDDGLNAFAVGRKPETAAVAVTRGLLKRLNRDELQGVIGHEIGHVKNLDIRFMTLASVMVGSIAMLSDIFFRSTYYGGGRRTRRDNNGGGQAQAILMIIAMIVAILAPIAAQLLYFACSRKREYLADASSARFTRYPPGLASALVKIGAHAGLAQATRASAPLFIINPLNAAGDEGWFSTHPPLTKRVEILHRMGGEAGFAAYQQAYSAVETKAAPLMSEQTVNSDEPVTMREPSAPEQSLADLETVRQDQILRMQNVTDLLARIGNYLVLPCSCGMKIKLPPEFKGDSITCPRCGTQHRIPQAQLEFAQATLPDDAQDPDAAPPRPDAAKQPEIMRYQRRGHDWESFKCLCGQTQQLSPNFVGDHITCRKCGREIQIMS